MKGGGDGALKRGWVATASVSRRMKQIRTRHTGLEGSMQSLLRRARIRFRSQPKHFGKPDFRIAGAKLLVFCDSSFWHGRGFQPKWFTTNRHLWVEKIKRTVERDRLVNRVLRREGWYVLRFWDFQILRDPERVVARIRREYCVRQLPCRARTKQ
jgi:DNA mismatch endonuclease, patch repair protein